MPQQSALQVLVEQHYTRLKEVIDVLPEKDRPTVAKYAGQSTRVAKQKTSILEGLADGSVHLVVGTKALISEDVIFKKLGLAIIDEQHK